MCWQMWIYVATVFELALSLLSIVLGNDQRSGEQGFCQAWKFLHGVVFLVAAIGAGIWGIALLGSFIQRTYCGG